jgi:hypothetical protein
VHAVLAGADGGGVPGALRLGALAVALGAAAASLGALGTRLRCPRPAAAAIACGVLWAAATGVWWADDAAERLPLDRRSRLRQAVLRVDWVTSAAYGAGYDRLRAGDVYAKTTIGTLALEPPRPVDTALWWGAVAAFAGLGASLLRRPVAVVARGTTS